VNAPSTTAPTSDRRKRTVALWLIVIGSVILIGGVVYGLLAFYFGLQSAFGGVETMRAPAPGDVESGVHAANMVLAGGLAVASIGAVLAVWGWVLFLRRRTADESEAGDWSATSDPRA
jgi:hypothetical protein